MSNNISFNKNTVEETLPRLGVEIEKYIKLFKKVMILPKESKEKKEVIDAIKTAEKLIKKLKKGDTSVFNDEFIND